MDEQAVVERTRRWIATMVIGLNLCPFARRVFDAGTIRYAVTDVREVAALLGVLAGELAALTASAAFETAEDAWNCISEFYRIDRQRTPEF